MNRSKLPAYGCVLWSLVLSLTAGCSSGGGGGGGGSDGGGLDGDQEEGSGNVVISEFLASNGAGLLDEDGEHSDWIELHNAGAGTVNLAGWALTDDAEELTRWILPDVTLDAGEYLVVFASGKDRTPTADGNLHTNFNLDDAGEYLALIEADGESVAHEYAPEYPEQYEDISYGVTEAGPRYFETPTPGTVNGEGSETVEVDGEDDGDEDVEELTFSHEHGFYDSAFTLTLASGLPGASIRYTLDGSAPTESTGEVYDAAIEIEGTTCVRVAAFVDGAEPLGVTTQTYLFLDEVASQPAAPEGFPDTWGWDEAAEPPEWTAADYEMDPAVASAVPLTDDEGEFDLKDALLAIPTLSLVMDMDDLFDQSSEADTGGIYANPWEEGVLWERPASVELIHPDGSEGFQVNCGIRIYGGMGRSPWAKKHTLRLLFKSDYGPTKLDYPLFGEDAADEFDTVILRANFNDSWTMLWDSWKLERVQLVRDEWIRASHLAMGSVGVHGTFVHLYINGLYWGLYNPVERPDASFSATYRGGDKNEWDALHDGNAVDGDTEAWNRALEAANAGLSANEAYQRIQGNNSDGTPNEEYENLLDVQNLADYMLLNFYAGTEDWDMHNWYAGRPQDGSAGYQIYVWDGEITHLSLEGNDLTGMDTEGCPSRLFQALLDNTEFRVLFADRVHYHLFNDGVLTAENAGARYRAITDQIDRAIVAESARWGDTVRSPAYTRDVEWSTERDWLLNDYFPQRGEIVLGFLREAGMYPALDAPEFSINGTAQHGGQVQADDELSITTAAGTVWYTLDGTDPRQAPTAGPATRQAGGGGGQTLVPQGAVWQYLDDGTDPGANWTQGTVAWSSGAAELGYGDGDEQTVVDCGPSAPDCNADNFITTYFRHTFNVSEPAEHGVLTLRLLRDDGAVVYLNGQEIVRSNLPADGAIDAQTLATDAGDTESTWSTHSIEAAGLLVAGDNVLAVEVHQVSAVSSDISFNLELLSGELETGDGGDTPPEDAGDEGAGGEVPGTVSATASEYTGPITLTDTVQVKARVFDGANWSALTDATFTVFKAPELVINEIMADNAATVEDPDDDPGIYEDWIELYNPVDLEVDLGGLYLTDDLTKPTKWQIPAGVTIEAGGYLLIWADDDTGQGDTHAGFKLNVDGEDIGLFGSDGTTEIDSLSLEAQTTDVSYGRYPNGADTWHYMTAPTPGAANEAPKDG